MTGPKTNVDAAELESYFAKELGVHVIGTELLNDGLNQVVAVSTDAAENAYVLRRPRKLRHTGYMNDLKQEYEVLGRLRETPIAAPEPVAFCADESVLGDCFFVTAYVEGTTVPLGSDLPERFRNPNSRRTLADCLIGTLAEIHSLNVEPFEGVCERRPPREQVTRCTDRLEAATDLMCYDPLAFRPVADWLQRNVPPDPETTLIHGDFRPGNVLFAGQDVPEITGVLDWETACLGDPLVELGYLLLRWHDDGDPTPSLDRLESRYPDADAVEELREQNERGLVPFTARPGSPSRRELVARYETETGRSFENERFYRAYAAFALATVWADLHRNRREAGEESNWEPYVEYMLLLAERIVDGAFER